MTEQSLVEQVRLVQDEIYKLSHNLDVFEAQVRGNEVLSSAVLQRFLSGEDSAIAHGDTEWVLMSSVVVIMMTMPGIMLYYAGSVRVENVLATAMQGFSLACVVTLLWTVIGYSLAFAPALPPECDLADQDAGGSCATSELPPSFIGDASRAWLSGIQHSGSHQIAAVPETAFCMYQLAFAIITPVLISGALVDRMKYNALLTSLGLWHLLIYCPITHVFWHPDGFLYRLGVLDFAGGCVVHVSAGFSALVAALIIGKRVGFGKRSFHPHNMLVSITGACFLWIGWYGFNAGSAFAADSAAGIAFLNTQIASSSAALSWMFIEFLANGQPSIVGLMNGSIAGLVAVTPCSGLISAAGSFFVGLAGGLACFFGVKIKKRFDFDDSLDCFGIHGVGGVVGSLLVGCLAKESLAGVNGAFYGDGYQLVKQIIGTLFTIAYSSLGTAVILYCVDRTMGLRLSEQEERSGMDRAVHNTNMYSQLSQPVAPGQGRRRNKQQRTDATDTDTPPPPEGNSHRYKDTRDFSDTNYRVSPTHSGPPSPRFSDRKSPSLSDEVSSSTNVDSLHINRSVSATSAATLTSMTHVPHPHYTNFELSGKNV